MVARFLLVLLLGSAPALAATPLEVLERCRTSVTRIQRFVGPHLGGKIRRWQDPAPGGKVTPAAAKYCERWNRTLRTGQWLRAVAACGATTTPAPVYRVEVRGKSYVAFCSLHGDAGELRYRILDVSTPVPAEKSAQECALNVKTIAGALQMYAFEANIDLAKREKLERDWLGALVAGRYVLEEPVCPASPAKRPTYVISIGSGAWIIRCAVHGERARD